LLLIGIAYVILVSVFLIAPKWRSKKKSLATDNLLETHYIDAIESGDNCETWLKLGNTFAAQGQHEKAIEYFDRAIKHEPFAADAWEGMGASLSAMMRFKDAVDAYNAQIEAIKYHSNQLAAEPDSENVFGGH
jgi:tetratricopeptide (TPR) repeat protein